MSNEGRLRRLLRALKAKLWGAPLIYLLASVLARAGAFALIPLYTRTFRPEEYGEYALASTILLGVSTLVSLPLVPAVSRFYFDGRTPAEGHKRAGAVSKWFLLFTAAALVLLLAPALAFGGSGKGLGGRWELGFLIAGGAGAAVAGVPTIVFRVSQRPVAASVFQLGQFLATVLGGILFVTVLGRGLRGAIEALGLSYVLTGLVATAFLRREFSDATLDRATLKDAIRFSLSLAPDALGNYGRSVGDRWLLKRAGLDAGVGEFALANQMLMPAALVTEAWTIAEGVRIGEIYRERGLEGVMSEFRSIVLGFLAASILPGIGIVIAIPLLTRIVGREFGSAFLILPVLAAAHVLESIYSPSLYVVFYASKTRLVSFVTLATMICLVVLMFILIPLFGATGAAIARGGAGGFRATLMWLAARKCFREAAVLD